MAKPSKRIQEAAKVLLKRSKGKGDFGFGYRAYLLFNARGESGSHLVTQFTGDQRKGVLKAQDDLLEAAILKQSAARAFVPETAAYELVQIAATLVADSVQNVSELDRKIRSRFSGLKARYQKFKRIDKHMLMYEGGPNDAFVIVAVEFRNGAYDVEVEGTAPAWGDDTKALLTRKGRGSLPVNDILNALKRAF